MIRFKLTACVLFLSFLFFFLQSSSELSPTFFSLRQAGGTSCGLSGKRRKKKHLRGWFHFDVKLPALTFFLSLSWFSGLCGSRPIWSAPGDPSYFPTTTAHQPSPEFSDISPQHLDVAELRRLPCSCPQNCFAASLAGSTGRGQWTDEWLQVQKRLRTKPRHGSLFGMTVIKAWREWTRVNSNYKWAVRMWDSV